jgi:hypothetical protein
MLNTFIKNQGMTKTIIHNNNGNHINQTNWDADYDGKIANLSINTNTDGQHEHFDIKLNNRDLANLLNVQTVDIPIDKRLKMDFQHQESYYLPENYYIELPTPRLESIQKPEVPFIKEINKPYISTPVTGEELIIPLTIDRKTSKKYTPTTRGRHKRLKTHITYKVYKKPKSRTKSSLGHRRSRRSHSSSKKSLKTLIESF